MPYYVAALYRCLECDSLTEHACTQCYRPVCPRPECRKDHQQQHRPVATAKRV